MGVVGGTWGAIKFGIILVLSVGAAAKLLGDGRFIIYVVAMLALLILITIVEQGFLIAVPERQTQFDSLRRIVSELAQISLMFLSYVLATALSRWFESNYMNGPQVLELALIVLLIIFIFGVAAQRISQYSTPKPQDVRMLGAIAAYAVSVYTPSSLHESQARRV